MSSFQLRVVVFVLQRHPSVTALKHIGPAISSFLGPGVNLSLCGACAFGSTELLDWVWDSSCTSVDDRSSSWTLCNYLRSEPNYHQWQFRKALEVAAGRGDVKTVNWLLDHFSGFETPSEVVTAAAKGGHFPVLKLLLDRDAGRDKPHKAEEVTVLDDEWVDSVPVMPKGWSGNGPGNAVRWGGHAIREATSAGFYSVARWLHDNTPHHTNEIESWEIVEIAANAGAIALAEAIKPPNRNIMRYMHSETTPAALKWILENGHEELTRKNQDMAAMALRVAAGSGDLELTQRIAELRNARKRNSDWPELWECSIIDACSRGDLPMVQWLTKQPLGRKICKRLKDGEDVTLTNLLRDAAGGGSVEVVEYLFKQGFTDENASAMVRAAGEGRLECMKWLIEHTPLYGYLHSATDAVKAAASNGHLSILQFIHDQEASLPRGLIPQGSEYDVKRRLVEEPIHWWATVREGFDEAAANGHLEVVTWIRANHFDGCTTKAMDGAARNGHLDVVKFLHANTTTGCTTLAMDSAASKNRFDVLKWLHANRTEGCTMQAVEHAIAFDNFNTLAPEKKRTEPLILRRIIRSVAAENAPGADPPTQPTVDLPRQII